MKGGRYYIGALAGQTDGALTNVTAYHCKLNSMQFVGVIAGFATAGGSQISVTDCTVTGTGYVGAALGNARGMFEHITATDCTVLCTSSNVGGAVGFGESFADVTVTGGSVTGKDNVGGAVGYTTVSLSGAEVTNVPVNGESNIGGAVGYSNKSPTDNATVTDCTVTGSGNNVGGVAGYSYGSTNVITGSTVTYAEAYRETHSVPYIKGAGYVGGIVGYGFVSSRDVRIRDNKVFGAYIEATSYESSSSGDSGCVGGVAGYYNNIGSNLEVWDTVVKGNRSTGGVVGYVGGGDWDNLRAVGCAVINDAQNTSSYSPTGGIFGCFQGGGPLNYSTVRDTEISGMNNVGGLIGYSENINRPSRSWNFIAEDVTVTAMGKNAGGLIGCSNRVVLSYNACGATVKAVENAGGFVGYANTGGSNSLSLSQCYFHGTIDCDTNAALAVGYANITTTLTGIILADDGGKTTVFNTADGVSVTESGIYIYGVDGVNTTWLVNQTNYTKTVASGGAGFTSGQWNFSGLNDGYMPYPGSTPVSYSKSYDAYEKATVKNGVVTHTTKSARTLDGIVVPGGSEPTPLRSLMMSRRAVTPTYTYASGVDTINVETGADVSARAIDPAADGEYLRTVMAWGGYWYYVNGSALVYGDETGRLGTVEGVSNVVHLWQGQALDSAGNIYDLSGGAATLAGKLPEGGAEAKPFLTWGDTDVYYAFSVVDGVTVPCRALPNGATFTAAQGVVYDGFAWCGDYFAYLAEDGAVVTAGAAEIPGGWPSTGVAHMSNGEAPFLVLRYTDGTASVVDLSTGTVLDNGSSSLISYVRHELSTLLRGFTASPLRADASLAASLAPGEPVVGDTAAADPSGAVSEGGGVAENASGEEIEGEDAEAGGEAVEGEGGEETDGAGDEAGDAEEAGEGSEEGSAQPAAAYWSAERGVVTASGETVVEPGRAEYVESVGVLVDGKLAYVEDKSAEPLDEVVAVLSLAEARQRVEAALGASLPVYDEASGQYELFETASLAGATEDAPPRRLAAEEPSEDMPEEPEGGGEFAIGHGFGRTLTEREKSGFALLYLAMGAAAVLLVALSVRVLRRRQGK